jgi:endogenous inhibitor of DNA gyrase (YacG/DUF329 family)
MSTTERTVKCPICGEPYKVYAYTTADQSACPQCVRKAETKVDPGTKPYEDHPGYHANKDSANQITKRFTQCPTR